MGKLQLAVIGCGGMGNRHLRGLRMLKEYGQLPFDVVGACDTLQGNAEYLADNAEEMLGTRPRIFTDMEAMCKSLPEIEAVDITTPNGTMRPPSSIWVAWSLVRLSSALSSSTQSNGGSASSPAGSRFCQPT